jgi:hypothetical protein
MGLRVGIWMGVMVVVVVVVVVVEILGLGDVGRMMV